MPVVDISAWALGNAATLSGTITSGAIASGQVGNFHVASGQIQGLVGAGVPNIASGTFGGFELGSGAIVSGRIASGVVGINHFQSGTAAAQADVEPASLNTCFLTPGNAKWHPGVAKVVGVANTTGTLAINYNLDGVTDSDTGDISFTITTDFSSTSYVACGKARHDANVIDSFVTTNSTAGVIRILIRDTGGTNADPQAFCVAAFGDQ